MNDDGNVFLLLKTKSQQKTDETAPPSHTESMGVNHMNYVNINNRITRFNI